MARGDGDGWVRCRCGSSHWGRFGAAGLVLLRRGAAGVVPGGPAEPGSGFTSRPAAEASPSGPTGAVPGRPDASPEWPGTGPSVLLQLRAGWTHQGGSWGVPGGARDSDEDDVTTALREAVEEAAVLPGQLRVARTVPGLDHGDWAYRYVLAVVAAGARGVEDCGDRLQPRTAESDQLRWVPITAVAALPLHDGLRAAWPGLHAEAGRVLAGQPATPGPG